MPSKIPCYELSLKLDVREHVYLGVIYKEMDHLWSNFGPTFGPEKTVYTVYLRQSI